jgi:hypothetical protein
MLCGPIYFVHDYRISDYPYLQPFIICLNVAKLIFPETIYLTINYETSCIVWNNPSSMGIKKAAGFSSYSSVGTG